MSYARVLWSGSASAFWCANSSHLQWLTALRSLKKGHQSCWFSPRDFRDLTPAWRDTESMLRFIQRVAGGTRRTRLWFLTYTTAARPGACSWPLREEVGTGRCAFQRCRVWLGRFMANKNSLKGQQEVPPPLACMLVSWKQWITVLQQKGTFLLISSTGQCKRQLPVPDSFQYCNPEIGYGGSSKLPSMHEDSFSNG